MKFDRQLSVVHTKWAKMSPTEHRPCCDSLWLGRQIWRGYVSAGPILIGGKVEERKEYGELITKKERRIQLDVKREMGIENKGPDLIFRELTWEILITQEVVNVRTFF